MPKFPTYNRQVSASSINVPFRQKQANTDFAQALQALGANVEKAGSTLQEIDEKVKKIEQTRKASDAELAVQKAINEYNVKFKEDMNPNNWQGYYDGLENEINGIVSAIDDPMVKEDVARSSSLRYSNAVTSMKGQAVSRNISMGGRNVEALKLASISSVDSNDPSIMMDARVSYENALRNYADLAGLPEEYISTQLAERDKNASIRWLNNVANTDPQHAIDMLGSMDHLSGEDKSKLEKSFESLRKTREKDIEHSNKLQQKSNGDNFMQTYLNGIENSTLDRATLLNEIRLARSQDLVTSEFTAQFEKILSVSTNQLNKYDPNVHIEANRRWAKVNEKNIDELNEFQGWLASKTGNGLDTSTSKKFVEHIVNAKNDAEHKKLFGKMYDSLSAYVGTGAEKTVYYLQNKFSDRVLSEDVINNPTRMQEIAQEEINNYRNTKNGERISSGDADFNTVGGVNVKDLRLKAQQQNKAVVVSIKNGKVVATGLTNRKQQ